ncbi:glycosyltransferase [Chryseobacterium gleum]|jgi:hypothetical protein|uniref:glycosyltransferase n=1 Tax=Chryseobacterium gleum TaxID=250 RepID=UPI00241DF95D|nr:glycosyltransferase [Chryseobacterium gleum]
MLSIIISSYQQQYYHQLVKNISETIGTDFRYEIIQIWNPNMMSITKAYNLGASKAQFENLLFLHEDLIFHTKDWGAKLIKHFSIPNVGILGLAGSNYVPAAPCSWTVTEKYNFINILQGNKNNQEVILLNTTQANINPVFAVDGVFLAIKKEIYNLFKFNEDIAGFHGYDLDFSLRVSKKRQNFIIDNILIEHFSKGNPDKKWFDTNVLIKQKLGADFHKKKDRDTEKKIFLFFLHGYFGYYPINIKNIVFTLQFFPMKSLIFKDYFSIAKKYVNYIKYSSQINKKNKGV